MNKLKIGIAVCLVVMLAAVMMSFAYADPPAPATGTATSVSKIWVDQQTGDPSGTYAISQASVGQTVFVYWTGVTPDSGTVNIQVTSYASDGSMYSQFWVNVAPLTPAQSGTSDASFAVPNVPNGLCSIDLYGQSGSSHFSFRVGGVSLLVLPESAIGALAAIGAGLAAFGIYSVVKAKRPAVAIHRAF